MSERKTKFEIQILSLLFAFIINSFSIASEHRITSANQLDAITLSAGDVVVMENGVWENQELELKGVGTKLKPIILKADVGGKVILTGNSKLSFSGEHLIIDGLFFRDGAVSSGAVINFRTSSSEVATNCRLTNTKIVNYNPPGKNTEYKWVSIYGQNNRVDHCHFEGKTHNGALLVIWLSALPNYHQIDSNYFGPRPDLGYNGGEIIRIGTSDWSMYDSYSVVENNLFEECDGEIEIISNKSCRNIYRNNTFRNSEGTLTLRHGNKCEVYNNFFFGINNKECGGIRVIGEDHKVYNNYLQDLNGGSYRSAISIVNGVPNSPLNRYFQVKNAEIVNNTIVNCKHPIVIGAGADSEKSLPPLDCVLSNNVVAIYSGSVSGLVEYEDDPINLSYQKNIMYGAPLGISQPSGIEVVDPTLQYIDIWRPDDTSAVISYGIDTFSYVTIDIEGQQRTGTNDAGCDQLSVEPIANRPIMKSDVGVDWEDPTKEVSAIEGGSKLKEYIDSASDGDVLILTSSGGIYELDSSAVLSVNIKIIAKSGLVSKPIIKAIGVVDEFVKIDSGGGLQLSGIEFDGGGNSGNSFLNALKTSSLPSQQFASSLILDNCLFHDFTNPSGGSLLHVSDGVIFEKFQISNTQIYDIKKQVWYFENGSRASSANITNCTFATIGREILFMNVATQGDANVMINHCTIDSVGYEGELYKVFSLNKVNSTIKNSLFTFCGTEQAAFDIMGANSLLDYCLFWKSGMAVASNNGVIGTNNINNEDPRYKDRMKYLYSFLSGSPAFYSANDNENMGDLYWSQFDQPGKNTLLSDLRVDNLTVTGFKVSIFNYTSAVKNPDSYVISATTQDSLASAKLSYPATFPGIAFIEVIAEDGVTKQTYSVDLHEIGSNAFLSDILIDGISIDGFEPSVLKYGAMVQNPESYTVSANTQDTFATYEISNPGSIPGTSLIEVIAENGINKNYYSIKLNALTSVLEINNNVEDIAIYPNPCHDLVSIKIGSEGTLRIYNQVGKLERIVDIIPSTNTVELTHLPKGYYILELTTRHNIYARKLLVE